MNSKFYLSVLMPMYNASTYLHEAMESVLCQTFSDFEFLIIDDGSTDDSAAIVRSYQDERIRLIVNAHDFIASLNKGINIATGKYIARMDADDVMLPHRLETQYKFMEAHPDIDVCGSWFETIGSVHRVFRCVESHRQIIIALLLRNCMMHPTIMMRRSIFANNPELRYPNNYVCAEDYKMWTILVNKGFRFANIPEILLHYRYSPFQASHRLYDISRESIFRIQMEYTEQVMALMVEKDERYFDFFDQLVCLSNESLISPDGLFNTIYHAYSTFLEYYSDLCNIKN